VGPDRVPEWVYCFGAERTAGTAGVVCPLAELVGLDACAACPFLVDADAPRTRRWSCSSDPTDDASAWVPNGDHR
jgi:hypothetical protein